MIGNDIPITSVYEDKLNVKKEIMALCEFIKNSPTPLTISIQGEWGCGKSSFMKCVEKELCNQNSDTDFEGIWINAWDFFLTESSEYVVESIIQKICAHFAERDQKASKIHKRMRQIGGFKKLVKAGGQVANISENSMKEVIGVFSGNILQKKEVLKKYISQEIGDKSVIVFVDDLDRLEPEMALNILEALKIFFDIEKMIFVLAIDKVFLERGVVKKYNLMEKDSKRVSRDFFEKIIQVPYSIPIARFDITYLVESRLSRMGFLDDSDSEIYKMNLDKAIEIVSIATDKNPRRINRILNILELSMLSNTGILSENDSEEFKLLLLTLMSVELVFPEVYSLIAEENDFRVWSSYSDMAETSVSELEVKKYGLDQNWKKVVYIRVKDENSAEDFFKCIRLLDIYSKYQGLVGNDKLKVVLGVINISGAATYDGDEYNKNSAVQYSHGMRFIKYYEDIIKNDSIKKILDAGCGNGKTTIDLLNFSSNADIDASDISESQIETAKSNYSLYLKENAQASRTNGAIRFMVKDIIDLNASEEYDLIFSSSMLHWVEQQEKAYINMFNALSSGGYLISNQAGKKDGKETYSGIHDVVRKAINELGYSKFYPENWKFPMYCFSEEEMKGMLEKIGFVEVETKLLEGKEENSESLVEAFITASLIFYRMPKMTNDDYQKLADKFRELMKTDDVDLSYRLLYVSARKPAN